MSLADTRGVLFDLDGTLVDSAPDLATAVNRMLVATGRAPVDERTVRGWVGNGARRLVARALTGRRDEDPPMAVLESAESLFFEAYAAVLTDRTQPYPGVVETLRTLGAAGYRLGVVTNKPTRFTVPLLEALGLARYFATVVCGDTLPEKKPDAMPIEFAARELGVPIAACVLVGDSMTDVRAANNAGCPIVCVPYGYAGGDDMFSVGANAVIERMDDLPALLIEGQRIHHATGCRN